MKRLIAKLDLKLEIGDIINNNIDSYKMKGLKIADKIKQLINEINNSNESNDNLLELLEEMQEYFECVESNDELNEDLTQLYGLTKKYDISVKTY